MNRISAAIAGIAMLGMLTACSGARQDMAPLSDDATSAPAADMKEGVAGAPAPAFGPPPPPEAPVDVQRDVVKTATMTITVANTSEAADKAAVLAEDADGRVDSRSEDAGSARGLARTAIVLRVPVGKLDEVVRELKKLGKVQNAETTAEDVTAQRVDLDARIRALQTSVDRLLAIMRDAQDPEALIQAEDALSERQAELDSLRAQRDQLGDQIAYSTINATFVAEQVGGPAPKQYEGFTGQVERGWDTLVSVVGNLLMLLGLLLPWLAVIAVAAGIIYVVVRLARPKPAPKEPATATPPGSSEESEG